MNTPSRFLACPDNDKADDMNTQRVIRDIQTEGGKGCCKTLGDPQETGPTHLSYIPADRPRQEGVFPSSDGFPVTDCAGEEDKTRSFRPFRCRDCMRTVRIGIR